MSVSKILIFGMPRTATTQLQTQLSKYYQVKNLSEPFTDPQYGFNPSNPTYNTLGVDPYTWTSQQTTCSMKLLALNLFYIDIVKLIETSKFDIIVITKRKNLTDCCISLFVAEQLNQYHHISIPNVGTFKCDEDFVRQWVRTYNKFNDCVDLLDEHSVKYSTVYYEDYVNNQDIVVNDTIFKMSDSALIPYLNTAIPYRELCTNYDEVENIIRMNVYG